MIEEILKVFDMFSENASTEELKELIKGIKELYKENFRLHSIIKEVREYIKHEDFKKKVLLGISEKKYINGIFNNILEILDKENKENEQSNNI